LALAALTAVTWGSMEVLFLRAVKAIGAVALVLWLAVMGTALALPLALATGMPGGDAVDLAAAFGTGAIGIVGGVLYFVALQHGQLAVVSPIVAAQAAAAAVVAAVVLGESLGVVVSLGLLGATVGVVLSAGGRGEADRLAVSLAVGSAVTFGFYNVALGETADAVGAFWAVLTYRALSLVVLLPWAWRTGNLELPRAQRRPLAAGAVLETIGFAALAFALAMGPVGPVAAVAVQYSTVAVVLAALLLRERLRPLQWAGVAVVLLSVLVIAATG